MVWITTTQINNCFSTYTIMLWNTMKSAVLYKYSARPHNHRLITSWLRLAWVSSVRPAVRTFTGLSNSKTVFLHVPKRWCRVDMQRGIEKTPRCSYRARIHKIKPSRTNYLAISASFRYTSWIHSSAKSIIVQEMTTATIYWRHKNCLYGITGQLYINTSENYYLIAIFSGAFVIYFVRYAQLLGRVLTCFLLGSA